MPRTPEQLINDAFARILAKHWRPNQYLLQRIESSTASGIPDIYLQCPRGTYWIESKAGEIRTSDGSRIVRRANHLSNEQINWHLRHLRAGGNSLVLVGASPAPTARLNSAAYATTQPPILTTSVPRLYLLTLSLTNLQTEQINQQIKKPAESGGLSVVEWLVKEP